MPLYLTLWARDALTTAWQAGIFDRGEMLRDVLAHFGLRPGQRVDPDRDEEPGRASTGRSSIPYPAPELTVRRLRVGEATVGLRFWRERDGGSHVEVAEKRGKLRIPRQPWLESYSTGWWQRMTTLVRSGLPL